MRAERVTLPKAWDLTGEGTTGAEALQQEHEAPGRRGHICRWGALRRAHCCWGLGLMCVEEPRRPGWGSPPGLDGTKLATCQPRGHLWVSSSGGARLRHRLPWVCTLCEAVQFT